MRSGKALLQVYMSYNLNSLKGGKKGHDHPEPGRRQTGGTNPYLQHKEEQPNRPSAIGVQLLVF